MSKKAIFAGSFDPFHNGHREVVSEALKLFDTLYIVITKNVNKEAKFSWRERLEKIEGIYKKEPKVIVLLNKNQLTANFAKDLNAQFLVRGIRNTTDFKYEYEMAKTNKALNENLETVFFFSDAKNAEISSSFLKEVESYKKD